MTIYNIYVIFFKNILTNFAFCDTMQSMDKLMKTTAFSNPTYDNLADAPFYLFFKKETFLLDVPHYHDSIEIIYMIHGKAKTYVNGTSYEFSEGDISICNTQQVHFYENYPQEKLAFCVVLSHKYTHDFRQVHKDTAFPSLLTNKEHNAKIYALLNEWFNLENRTFLTDCAYANLLLDMLVKLYGFSDMKAINPLNATAIELVNYINENYANPLTLETAAKHFGYSTEYFSKMFKHAVGKNFLSFLNTTRAQQAKKMLTASDRKLSLQEICTACGFNNTVSMYRNLKRLQLSQDLFLD